MSRIFQAARLMWREMHDAYTEELDRRIREADEACHGYLVNRAGKAEGIDSEELFKGSVERAYRFATEELVAHWGQHGRMTLAQFEAEWLSNRAGADMESAFWAETA